MKPDEPIHVCACCAVQFYPNQRQLGQALRGRRLYCTPECMAKDHRERNRAWWASGAGRDYARSRAAAVRAKRNAIRAAREARQAELIAAAQRERTA